MNWPLLNLDMLMTPEMTSRILRIALLLLAGLPLVYMAAGWLRSGLSKKFTPQRAMIGGKVVQYGGITLIGVMLLHEFGFQLGALLGTAGIVGIAIGFASQTSVSNIISGLFLIAEEPFVVGDIITVNNLTGEVLSIDTLSIKLRTFQNQFVRIPNETILKSEVTTVTRFPIRRIDLLVSVAYKEDLERVRNVLMEIAAQHPLCLKEPSPQLFYEGFGSSSIDIKLGLWATREDWLRVKTDIFERVKKRFDEEGIEIPFPHVSVYTGSVSEPFPVKMADGDAKG
ncbi:MAG: mechanosensitive ion channel family protein [Calditrichaeota bacterium]|nr:mechanosensitive ion channel family protein [Calditrichota bacterium]HQU72609.1 mechanosensitive ion channel family protein [Calditrichia bacterium]